MHAERQQQHRADEQRNDLAPSTAPHGWWQHRQTGCGIDQIEHRNGHDGTEKDTEDWDHDHGTAESGQAPYQAGGESRQGNPYEPALVNGREIKLRK